MYQTYPHFVTVDQARDFFVAHQRVSVSFLQRQFRVGYTHALDIVEKLQRVGVVTAPDANGIRQLSENYLQGKAEFREWAVSEFAGCDGGDPNAKIWTIAVEHGYSPWDGPSRPIPDGDTRYSIKQQAAYRYNRQMFKLLAAIHGEAVEDWRNYAERNQPFVAGAKGFFKANLYPYPCWSLDTWTSEAQAVTGFADKLHYQVWCRDHRFTTLAKWVARAEPELVIATGTTHRNDFVSVVFGGLPVPLLTHLVNVSGRPRMFFSASREGRLLVILPHLSGSPLFRSHAVLQAAGEQIAQLRIAACVTGISALT